MKPSRSFWIIAAFAALWLLIACAFAFPMYGQTTKPVGPCVWYQPASSHAKWHGRGIQILFGYENEGDTSPAKLDAWCASARVAGLTYVLQESGSAHWNDAACVGVFLLPDEPNAIGNKTPEEMAGLAAALRARTVKPLWLSLNGGAVKSDPDARTAAYCKSADVITFFSYAYNYSKGAAGVLAEVGPVLDKLHAVAPGKAIVYIGECSDQGIKKQAWVRDTPMAALMHGPNADEMAFEYGVAIVHGANGLGYFPDIINEGFGGFDGTTPECEAAMKNLNVYAANQITVTVVTSNSTPPATQPATQPVGGYGQAYVHLRTRDGGKTWYIAVP